MLIGNPRVLARQPLWNNLLTHFQSNDLLVEGPLGALKHSRMHLPPPIKYFNPRFNLYVGSSTAYGDLSFGGGGGPAGFGRADGGSMSAYAAAGRADVRALLTVVLVR